MTMAAVIATAAKKITINSQQQAAVEEAAITSVAEEPKNLSGPPSFWRGLVRPINACARGLLNESFLSDTFAGREGQTPLFKGPAYAVPALAKNTL